MLSALVAYIKCYAAASVVFVSLFTFSFFFFGTHFCMHPFSVHCFEMHNEMSKCNEVTELQPQFS